MASTISSLLTPARGRSITVLDSRGVAIGAYDTIDDIRPVAAAYILTSLRESTDESGCPLPPPPLSILSSHKVMSDLSALAGRLSTLLSDPPLKPRLALTVREAARYYLRAYSDLDPGPITSPGLISTRWWSECEADGLVGATIGTRVDFLRDSYTWISLPPPHLQLVILGEVAEAITTSQRRCRAVILLEDSPATRVGLENMWTGWSGPPDRRPRHHIIATYRPGCIPLYDSLLGASLGGPYTHNLQPALLAIAESPDMPDTDMVGLSEALRPEAESISTPPWDAGHPPGDMQEPSPTEPATPTLRYHPIVRPSLNWYRSDAPTLRRPPDQPPPSNPVDLHTRVLGMMGLIPPIKLSQNLPPHVHPPSHTKHTLSKISALVRDTSLEAFRKSEIWAKWKRKRR